MDTLECIRTRRSIRKYLDEPVEFEKVGEILDAGRNAPSAGNIQDWKFILVTELSAKKEIAEACLQQYWMESAPVHIVICSQPEKSERFYGERGRKLYSIQNSAAAAQNMLIASNDQGLGSCWVSAFNDDMLRRALNIPVSITPYAVITIGYADETPATPPKFPVENVVFIEKWGNRIRDISAFMEHYAEYVVKAAKTGKEFVQKAIEKIKE
ncbi:nitroreductase family protein [Candidatus Woesearchaeota archaeon]|nr:nitroreductase family protein [Candidatus Woesearchaeota archaeon]